MVLICLICLLYSYSMLYFKRCACSKILRKEDKIMQQNILIHSNKDFIEKVLFFICLLTGIAFLYIESKQILDLTYFVVVFIIFIRYIIMKLYQ